MMTALTRRGSLLALLLIFAAALAAPLAHAQGKDPAPPRLKVAATLPYLGELVRRVGGDLVEVIVLAKPGQDPHFIEATPQDIVRVKGVSLLVENGMQLEGWSAAIVEKAKKPELQPGAKGHCYATNGLFPIELPTEDEIAAGGHVHAAGNPHIWLDPINLKIMARNIERALAGILRDDTAALTARRVAFEKEIDELFYGPELVKLFKGRTRRLDDLHRKRMLMKTLATKKVRGKLLADYAGGLLRRALDLGELKLVTYHKTWSYFEAAFGFKVIDTVESKPGVEPSPAHLAQLAKKAKSAGATIVMAPPYYPSRNVEGAAKKIGAVALIMPTQPGEGAGAGDLIAMFDTIFDRLEGAAKSAGS
jgi:zinc/manganese transport system substrate-binding protein